MNGHVPIPARQDQLVTAATVGLEWIKRGVSVFPIAISWNPGKGKTDKRPLTDHGYLDATTDEAVFGDQLRRAKPKADEVVAVAVVPGSAGYVVFDGDTKDHAGDPVDGPGNILGELTMPPYTFTVDTASGGIHKWYRKRDPNVHVGNSAAWQTLGIDIRADSGYVVAPGTSTPWGSWRVSESPEWPTTALVPESHWQTLAGTSASLASSTSSTWRRYQPEIHDALLHPATVQVIHWLASPDRDHPIDLAAVVFRERSDGEPYVELTRPGKHTGASATVGFVGPGVMKVFTSNWPGLTAEEKYVKDDLEAIEQAAQDPSAPYWTDLGWLNGGTPPVAPTPTFALRDDGIGLFYRAAVNGVFGDPETGKSWLAHIAVVEALQAGGRAAIIDADHNTAPVTARRLMALGAAAEHLANPDRFRYVEPDDAAGLIKVVADLAQWQADVVVLDSLGELLPLMRASSNDNDEVTFALRTLTTKLIAAGACIIHIDHLPKNPEAKTNGYAIGGSAKKRATRGSYLRVVKHAEIAPGKVGRIGLHIEKDSLGSLRAASESKNAGVLTIDATDPNNITWTIDTGSNADADFRPTVLMERVSRWLEQHPGEHSRNAIATAVSGKRQYLLDAIDALSREGYLSVTEQARGGRIDRRYSHQTLFTEDQDLAPFPYSQTVPQPFPEQSQDPVSQTVPRSLPLQGEREQYGPGASSDPPTNHQTVPAVDGANPHPDIDAEQHSPLPFAEVSS